MKTLPNFTAAEWSALGAAPQGAQFLILRSDDFRPTHKKPAVRAYAHTDDGMTKTTIIVLFPDGDVRFVAHGILSPMGIAFEVQEVVAGHAKTRQRQPGGAA